MSRCLSEENQEEWGCLSEENGEEEKALSEEIMENSSFWRHVQKAVFDYPEFDQKFLFFSKSRCPNGSLKLYVDFFYKWFLTQSFNDPFGHRDFEKKENILVRMVLAPNETAIIQIQKFENGTINWLNKKADLKETYN